jgi:uncharacterized damage-inducible protein DinB
MEIKKLPDEKNAGLVTGLASAAFAQETAPPPPEQSADKTPPSYDLKAQAALDSGFTPKGFEKSTTDKAKVIEWLNKSFIYAIASVQSMSNAQFAAPLPKLGPQANEGDVVYRMVVHAHEHLGQAIAYSRSVGVVPPWTAEAAKKNPKAPQD